MIISLPNLRRGIDWWLENTKWSSEFVNDEYYELYQAKEQGTSERWWTATVERLWSWKAIRAPKPPNTKVEITKKGLALLDPISVQYLNIRERSSSEPSIELLSWEEVAPLFGLALEIKDGSQVFACKMCHFLFPKVFLVIGQLGNRRYGLRVLLARYEGGVGKVRVKGRGASRVSGGDQISKTFAPTLST